MIGAFFIIGRLTNKNASRTYNVEDIFDCMSTLTIGAMYFGASSMNIQALKRGLDWAGKILAVIDRTPSIDIYDQDAEKIDTISDIKFENVTFKYEGRNKVILDNVSLCFKKGK